MCIRYSPNAGWLTVRFHLADRCDSHPFREIGIAGWQLSRLFLESKVEGRWVPLPAAGLIPLRDEKTWISLRDSGFQPIWEWEVSWWLPIFQVQGWFSQSWTCSSRADWLGIPNSSNPVEGLFGVPAFWDSGNAGFWPFLKIWCPKISISRSQISALESKFSRFGEIAFESFEIFNG